MCLSHVSPSYTELISLRSVFQPKRSNLPTGAIVQWNEIIVTRAFGSLQSKPDHLRCMTSVSNTPNKTTQS